MGLALLTGVGRKGQVGEAVAARLAADGFDLILVDRTPTEVGKRAEDARRLGIKATAYACDLSDPEAVSSLFDGIQRVHGPKLDACVHMAGGFGTTGLVAGTDLEAWNRQLTINLTTAMLVARGAIPLLRPSRGTAVFFSSESAMPGAKLSRISGYAVAKYGVLALAIAVSQEERDSGVRANILAPAAIRTGLNTKSMAPDAKFVEREDVAATVSYLCSDGSRAISGQVLRLTAR